MPSRIWYLLARKLADEATLDEIRELEGLLLQNSDDASLVEIYTNFFKKEPTNDVSSVKLNTEWEYLLEKMPGAFEDAPEVPEETEKPKITGKKMSLRYGLAACLLLVISFGVWIFYSNETVGTLVTGISTNQNEIAADSDGKIKTSLPDGSQVWLNKGSKVMYDAEFGKSNRELTLIGEAFFDVVHRAELPMVVHAGNVEVRVKGTAFNVKAYSDDDKVEASLIRGSIEVRTMGAGQERLLIKPNEKVVIRMPQHKVGAKPIAVSQRGIENIVVDTLSVEERSGLIPEISWIQGKLAFQNETFSELADKLERWYKVDFIIEDKDLTKERFTGVFENETLPEALSALQFTYGFNYSIEKNKIIITKK